MMHSLFATVCVFAISGTFVSGDPVPDEWMKAMKDGFWAKDLPNGFGDAQIRQMQNIIDSAHVNFDTDMSGVGKVGLMSQLITGLSSLEDTDGVLEAIEIYGQTNYQLLMFWAWIHRLSKELYENAMHVILMHEHMHGQMSEASNASQRADRMLLLRLFHYMLEHYHGSTWAQFIKTLRAYKPYLMNLAKNMRSGNSNGPYSPPDDLAKYIVQMFGTNGKMSVQQVNHFANQLDNGNFKI